MSNIIIETIKSRRSIRGYKNEQITDKQLNEILEVGMHAPSSHNSQSWHFTVIQNKEVINNISNKSKEVMLNHEDSAVVQMGKSDNNIFYNAPTVIVVSGNENSNSGSTLVDCSAAIENMLIAAESLGLGSIWIGQIKFFFTLKDEVKKLNIPEGYKPHYAIAIGYKDEDTKIKDKIINRNVINFIK
ncbi:nitroreductase family protein [Clostridium botulinum]|uniref:Nitroreductase n=1 Tax=Clostridium botulinum C/D str. DC5 TaxID=1443128 RepID=A0A0A0IEQ4_CLOBO|nr:nitroreductase family protein [Clostridium botulinum]KEI00548.1 nitroreductase [Clostridium botulinum C/D str. BKT75002]KEI11205.1 nitroreductase [Clostridium botulinum C/D str. BKT2873]KGM93663.1 nitroreductase [Clostridium botulinum D str. CCUG 7971]KGM99467.1 nitroreductase [Clostridium botulinum C/D str. DC5]KOC47816.1 nitroreductase [Clostridium botulinum]